VGLQFNIKTFTDSARGASKGCGIYFDGEWARLNWPSEWEQGNILKDITYLELIPIALSVYIIQTMILSKFLKR
jgi:hypothetical protein